MLAYVVIPSIGMTLFIVLSSFINFSIGTTIFAMALFFLIIIGLLFISMFKSIRPTVNL